MQEATVAKGDGGTTVGGGLRQNDYRTRTSEATYTHTDMTWFA